MTRNQMLAEDLTQQALATAWAKFSTLRDDDRFGGWLARIVVNLCRDELRKQKRRPVLLELGSIVADAPDPETALSDSLGRAFADLSADERALVVLRFYRDLTVAEVASLLAIPEGTVKSRLHRTMARMRASLERMEMDQ